jgi:hypothetical protein
VTPEPPVDPPLPPLPPADPPLPPALELPPLPELAPPAPPAPGRLPPLPPVRSTLELPPLPPPPPDSFPQLATSPTTRADMIHSVRVRFARMFGIVCSKVRGSIEWRGGGPVRARMVKTYAGSGHLRGSLCAPRNQKARKKPFRHGEAPEWRACLWIGGGKRRTNDRRDSCLLAHDKCFGGYIV